MALKPRTGRARAAAAVSPDSPGVWGGGLRLSAVPLAGGLAAVLAAEADARRLFPWLPACMGAGVALFFAADGVPSPSPAFLAAALLLTAAAGLRARFAPSVVCVGVGFVFLGFGFMALRTASVAAPVLDRSAFVRLSGFVETVDAGPNGGRLVIVVTNLETAAPVVKPERLRVTFRGQGPRAGDHIAGQARLMPPPQPAFPGGYDFARDAWFLGLGAVGRWVGPMTHSPAPRPLDARLAIVAGIDNARTDLTSRIARAIGGQAGALSAALVTGKRGLLEERVNDDLRASGLYHIVSISGLHMVLAAGVFFWLARALLALLPEIAVRHPIKKWSAGAAMVGATAYCIFSGSEVATERSLIMTLVMLGAILFDRPALSMRNLAIAAMIVLAREPETMAGPSFQMSFAAVAAMIAAHEWWLGRRGKAAEPVGFGGIVMRRIAIAVGASIATTLIASLATAPFAAYHFQRVNPYGLIGNALAIPFVSFIVMPAAVAGTLLLPFGLDGGVWQLMGVGSAKVLEVAQAVARVEGSVRGVRAFPISLLLWMSAGFVVLVLVRSPIRIIGLIIMAWAGVAAIRAPAADVFIERQGAVAAIRGGDGRLQILGRSASRFTIDRWLAADGDLRKGGDPRLREATICDRHGCVGSLPDGRHAALVLNLDAFEEDCRRARLIITPLPAPLFCAASAVVVDRRKLSESASLALYIDGDRFLIREARPSSNWKPWYGRPAGTTPTRAASPVATDDRDPALVLTPETSDDGAELILP